MLRLSLLKLTINPLCIGDDDWMNDDGGLNRNESI